MTHTPEPAFRSLDHISSNAQDTSKLAALSARIADLEAENSGLRILASGGIELFERYSTFKAKCEELEAMLDAVGAGGVGQSIKPQIQADTAQEPEVRIRTSAPSTWDWASLNNAADKIIRGKMVWKRFIDGTPLANDIACWMADFALEHAAPPEVPAPQEPVAWRVRPFNYGIGHEGVDALTTRKEQCEMWERKGWKVEPLYAAPQPTENLKCKSTQKRLATLWGYVKPQHLQPLTEDEIYECERIAAIRHQRHKHSIRGQQITPADDLQWHFARAIEEAHGITEGQL